MLRLMIWRTSEILGKITSLLQLSASITKELSEQMIKSKRNWTWLFCGPWNNLIVQRDINQNPNKLIFCQDTGHKLGKNSEQVRRMGPVLGHNSKLNQAAVIRWSFVGQVCNQSKGTGMDTSDYEIIICHFYEGKAYALQFVSCLLLQIVLTAPEPTTPFPLELSTWSIGKCVHTIRCKLCALQYT